MSANTPILEPIPSSLNRVGMAVGVCTLSSGAQHFHISAPDPQSSLLLAVPIEITDNSGVAHVLEHLLLTGAKEPGVDSLFFRTRASSSAADMNAVTNARYLAVHFTCDDVEEYFSLFQTFLTALFEPRWSNAQLAREIATITNEMEGALSDSNFNWQLKSYQSLFVEGSAQYNPGGDPLRIVEVSQEALLTFWKDYFSPSNLIAVSYGSQAGEEISAQLSRQLSQFNTRRKKEITFSSVTQTPRTQNLLGCSERNLEGGSASALLLGLQSNESTYLDIALVRSFVNQCSEDIVESLEQNGFRLQTQPGLKQIDSDCFLLLLFKNSNISSSKQVWDQVADICDEIIKKLSDSALRRLVHEALEHYFTLGNNKFGTGVAASIELLNTVCGSSSGEPLHDCVIDTEVQIDKYQRHSSWMNLIQKNIRMNGNQTLVVYDQSISPADLQSIDAIPRGNADHKELSHIEVRGKLRGADNPSLCPRPISEIQKHWLVPKIKTNNQDTIFHYRLPRPWISRVKITIPLPNDLIEQVGPSHRSLTPEMLTLDSQTHQLRASVNASKVPGIPAYRLYLSLSSMGDVSEMHEWLRLLNSPQWCAQLEQSVDQFHQSGDGVRRSLPLHKLAIYRCASRFSTLARVKLALAGYGETANAAFPKWRLRTAQYAALHSQPRTILSIDSAFEQIEVNLGVSNAHAVSAGHVDFVDNPTANRLADTDRQETIPGALNYCARVWTLNTQFGVTVEQDAIPHIFSALVTNLCLEPVLRGERSAYAASAEIDPELGMLVMFSYRDPNAAQTDAFFLSAFEQVIAGSYGAAAFEQSKKRAISRLQLKGSYDQRCEERFDQIVRGVRPDYFEAMKNAITQIDLSTFQKMLSSTFEGAQTAEFGFLGSRKSD